MSVRTIESHARAEKDDEYRNLGGGDCRESAGTDKCASVSNGEAAAVKLGASWWAGLPLGRGVELIAHDANGVAALCKPVGLLSHPNAAGDEARSLLRAPYDLKAECYELGAFPEADKGGAGGDREPLAKGVSLRSLWLLNRLDSATSGLLLVCANRELALKIRKSFRDRAVHKVYAALVFGDPKRVQGGSGGEGRALWRDRLSIEKRGGQIRTHARTAGGGVSAETRVTVLRKGVNGSTLLFDETLQMQTGRTTRRGTLQQNGSHGSISLLQLEPVTGRSHQLRVQCARRGLPIVGDATYGDFAANRAFSKAHQGTRGRLFLHSLETRFDYEWRGRNYHFAARTPLPEEFARFANGH